MMTEENKTYVIRYAYDLEGKTLIIPKGCNLKFKRNGSISNGRIVFSNTWLKNERFHNLESASGALMNNRFDSSRYGFSDDTEMFKFLFQQSKDGFELKLEPKTYHINSLKGLQKIKYDSEFARFCGLNGFSIVGNNATIKDSASKAIIGKSLYSVLQFDFCRDVSISGLSYIWEEEAVLHPKVEGIVFIRTLNECQDFDIDISVKNAGRGIYSGRWNESGYPGRGICDSRLKVNTNYVGYPIAIEKGDNLSIVNRFSYAHRGTYLAGVTNSTVNVEGKEAYSTKVNLLLTDTADSAGCYFCDGIKATVIDCGTKELAAGVVMVQCNTYPQSNEQFKGRQPYNVKSIEIDIHTPKNSSTSFEGFLYSDMAQVGDMMNIIVTGNMEDEGENSRLTRLRSVPQGTILFKNIRSSCNYIILDSEIPEGGNLLFENCPNIEFTVSSTKDNNTGTISFKGCSFRRYTKKDVAGTALYPIVKIE